MRTLPLAVLLCALLGLATSPLRASEAQDTAPDFTAEAAMAGKTLTLHLADLLKRGPVVLYFYPKAFTAGCTAQAHAFAKAMPAFKALKTSVIGMSGDDIDTLKKFSTSECSNAFPVAADPDLKIAAEYGATRWLLSSWADRKTYVIGQDGKILSVIDVSPSQHAQAALDVLRAPTAAAPKD